MVNIPNSSGLITRGFGEDHRIVTRGFGGRTIFDFGGIDKRFFRRKEYLVSLFTPILKENSDNLSIYSSLEKRNMHALNIFSSIYKEIESNLNINARLDRSKLVEILDAI